MIIEQRNNDPKTKALRVVDGVCEQACKNACEAIKLFLNWQLGIPNHPETDRLKIFKEVVDEPIPVYRTRLTNLINAFTEEECKGFNFGFELTRNLIS